ncbi:hypothetical protein Tco_0696208 [Tanacetum coccineum]
MNEFGDRVKLCDSVTKNKALCGRNPMLILLSSFLFLLLSCSVLCPGPLELPSLCLQLVWGNPISVGKYELEGQSTDKSEGQSTAKLKIEDAKETLWSAIKAKIWREELDSAYERFQHILSMLELYDAKVSQEDANLKFLRSLPSVWHVVATMIREQPGLDELGVFHKILPFCLQSSKSSTLKQSTANPENISKGYTQASSSKLKDSHNSSFNSDEIICSFFAQQASTPETHDDEDLLQIDDDAMEEIDIRWQKLGHFARECKFAKYQANRANGSKKKRIVPIEDSNSKALVAKDSQGVIDWTKEFDDDPVTFAMVAVSLNFI